MPLAYGDPPPPTYDCDVLIVGAGPVGLYAGYYAGFRGLSAVLVDSLPEVGGQITAMYPEKFLYDIAGFPRVRGRELVDQLTEQVGTFDHTVLLGQQARELTGTAGSFTVTMNTGAVIRAASILLTAGIGTFTPRPPAVGTEYVGRGMSYFVSDPEAMRHRDVLVVGGGDSAVDWALMLEPVANSVTLVHRRDDFRAHQHSVMQLRRSSVQLVTKAHLTAVRGAVHVESADVDQRRTTRTLKVQHIISALGFIAELGPLLEWGIELRGRYVAVDQHMATSRPGIYAAGDLADHDGKVRLLAVGFGEAATAINNLAVALDPAQALLPGHSSDQVPTPDQLASPDEGPAPVGTDAPPSVGMPA